jgi:hypothetical protein
MSLLVPSERRTEGEGVVTDRITDANGDELEHGDPDFPGQFPEDREGVLRTHKVITDYSVTGEPRTFCICGCPNSRLAAQPRSRVEGLERAVAKADEFLNVKGDPIAAHITLINALNGHFPETVTPTRDDRGDLCTCGHRRDHHIDRDVDDVVGWPCLDCRSKRCRGFFPLTPVEPDREGEGSGEREPG